jgi:S-adenosylmethionine synthetase
MRNSVPVMEIEVLSLGNEQKLLIKKNLKEKLRDLDVDGRIILKVSDKNGCEDVVWIQLVGARVLLQATVNVTMNV